MHTYLAPPMSEESVQAATLACVPNGDDREAEESAKDQQVPRAGQRRGGHGDEVRDRAKAHDIDQVGQAACRTAEQRQTLASGQALAPPQYQHQQPGRHRRHQQGTKEVSRCMVVGPQPWDRGCGESLGEAYQDHEVEQTRQTRHEVTFLQFTVSSYQG